MGLGSVSDMLRETPRGERENVSTLSTPDASNCASPLAERNRPISDPSKLALPFSLLHPHTATNSPTQVDKPPPSFHMIIIQINLNSNIINFKE